MKALKYILFLLLIAIIGLAIYIAIQPNEFEVSRTRTIKAPAAVVYDNVIDFKNWEAWSAWVEANPDMKILLSEQTKGIDGSYSWEDKDGIGTMKTIDATPNKSIKQEMQFADFPSSDVIWNFKPNKDGSTDATWTISGNDLPFGFKAFSTFMGGMEKQIAPYYERSLEKLDSIVQESMKVYTINIGGVTEYGGGFYMYKTTSATSANISQIIGKQFGEIMSYMSQNQVKSHGMPFTIYNEMNNDNGSVIMSNAIPVRDKVIVDRTSEVLCGYIPKTKVLKTTLKGNYSNLPNAWEATMAYLANNGLEQSALKPFEIYTNDPGNNPNPADWITEIYIPIK
ncbi:MAG: GyrI-like domain-containing protein [Algibacter sp.]|uniref:SRPBCC family protein n=1 Tax=Algibacter sp. TaxID=1872428 RepID=UPI00260D088C|nr:GyrI-like domain-containing protein [Algibacter sp.]MDG1728544.1 GyrI-like domain-containing protein [Algibacter sp.]MDG2179316.1 GyrI-like domain-containing protein [Algibacter sp.]